MVQYPSSGPDFRVVETTRIASIVPAMTLSDVALCSGSRRMLASTQGMAFADSASCRHSHYVVVAGTRDTASETKLPF
jgi:hypothetical protein